MDNEREKDSLWIRKRNSKNRKFNPRVMLKQKRLKKAIHLKKSIIINVCLKKKTCTLPCRKKGNTQERTPS